MEAIEANKDLQSEEFNPRHYQTQMFEICMEKNTIIYLPTGAGKTFIALMVIKRMAKDIQLPLSKGGKRTVFVVNTIALAKQQAAFIATTPLNSQIYTSERNVDTWKKDRWIDEFEKYQVIICTAQVILDVLKHSFLKVSNINLLIFDECHHARSDHPMHAIMEQFQYCPKEQRPRVIGLSGMLLYQQLKSAALVAGELATLENVFQATIAAVGSVEEHKQVLAFSTNPQELILPFVPLNPSTTNALIKGIVENFLVRIAKYKMPKYSDISSKTLMKSMPSPIKEASKLFKNFVYQMDDLGLFGASIAILGVMVEFELQKRSSDSVVMRNLMRTCIAEAEKIRHILTNVLEGCSRKEKLLKFSSQKVIFLIQFILQFCRDYDATEIKALVFVQRRFSAKCIYHLLKIYIEETENETLKPDFMIGNTVQMLESIESILEEKLNRKVLEMFKKGETNIIITTSVLEEGMDLQMCNLVIKYDHPQTFASYVQSKGRARMEKSVYVIMCDSMIKPKFLKDMALYKSIEEELKRCLIGKTINRPEPLDEDVKKELYDQLIPPFITKCDARLDALSAMQLLNRYATSIPSDSFTSSGIVWNRKNLPDGTIQVDVLLPLQSTVKDKTLGQPMANIKMAKRSAAFNACLRLYQNGELGENLIPIDSKKMLFNLTKTYFSHWEDFKDDKTKAGTKGAPRVFDVKYPTQTTNCTPQPLQKCFIYVLKMTTGFSHDAKNANINMFRDLYNSDRNFAIMTTKQLPKLATMKLFITLGLINVQVAEEPIEITAGTEAELFLLRKFHVMIFRNILKIWKSFLVYDYGNDINGYYIVPVLKNASIDWEVVKKFQELQDPKETEIAQRNQMVFRKEDYMNRVVHPWYRSEKDRQYVVTHVWDELTPNSEFPNEKYDTYADYFSQTYHQHIVRKDQFLVEVKGITTFLNRLNPGGEDDGRSTRAKHWDFQELLIPELCHNFEFPADYWLKATLLPSALHRLHYLLLAESIRVALAKDSGNGCLENRIILDLDVTVEKKTKKFEYDDDAFCDDSDDSEDLNPNNTVNSITYPNPETAIPKLINSGLTSYSNNIQTPWKEDEEPIDIQRNWDRVRSFELDYFDVFTRKFRTLGIGEQMVDQQSQLFTMNKFRALSLSKPVAALCDMSLDDKFQIKILKLNFQNTQNIPLQQKDIIKAITCASAGDVFDMERFEVLGDAFLKFSVSFYLIKNHPRWHEGYLTACKGRIVSNQNLLYCGIKAGIPGVLKLHNFDPKNDWQPPLLTVPSNIKKAMNHRGETANLLYKLEASEHEINAGHVNDATFNTFVQYFAEKSSPCPTPMQSFLSQQSVADKTVADSVEALLGVCINTVGVQRSLNFLPYFNILPKGDLNTLLDDKLSSPCLKADVEVDEVDQFLINYKSIEKILGYKFKDRAFLLQALTHGSYPTNRVTGSYEQLEFLGDAVLDFLISSYIFEQCREMDPGQITDLRSALVNNVMLACILVKNYLHLYILSESARLNDIITKFVAFQEENNHRITDQVQLLVEEDDLNIADYVDVPKVLGDVLESLIGAVFLDSGNDLNVTWKVIYNLMHEEIIRCMQKVPIQIVRQLYEFKGAFPKFSQAVVNDDIVMVKLRFTCKKQVLIVHGFGQNKDDAKKAAAKIALQKLKR